VEYISLGRAAVHPMLNCISQRFNSGFIFSLGLVESAQSGA
jgi:hypothetical protein